MRTTLRRVHQVFLTQVAEDLANLNNLQSMRGWPRLGRGAKGQLVNCSP